MKKHLTKLLSGFLAACLLAGSALAAEITPSSSSIEMEKEQRTFSFEVRLHADEAFAGAEFGLKPSASDVSLQSLEMLGSLKEEPQTKTVKDGVLYFCFYSSSNKYQPGDYTVARVTYAYAGTAARSVQLVSSKIVTVDESGRTAGAYCYDAVLWAVEQGITRGTTDTTFSPYALCSRSHIVAFLYRAQGSPAAASGNPFADVRPGSFYYQAALWAVAEGVTYGATATTFAPDTLCTRGQIVTFLFRAAAGGTQGLF